MRSLGRWDVGDPEVDAFVDANVLSFAAWDLLVFLNRNPSHAEPIARLAFLLARQEADLVPAVRTLLDNGILVDEGPPDDRCYRLSDDPAVTRAIASFIEMASRREHRLEFVRRVLGHLTGA